MEVSKVKFTGRNQSEFFSTLRKRIDENFEKRQASQFADGRMWFKIIFWLGAWVATWLLIMLSGLSGWWLVLFGVLHGFTHLFIAFNIAHDANHGAISLNKTVNNLFSCTLDLIGVNSYLWRFSHNTAHHSYVNVNGVDTSSAGYGIIRFNGQDKWKPAFRYQQYYASFLYAIATLNYVFTKDFALFLQLRKQNSSMSPSLGEWIYLIITKLFYYTYTLVLPTLFLPFSFWQILGVFVLAHALLGFTLALTFQTGHLIEGTSFPPRDEKGNVNKNWAVHIVETTTDYANTNPLLCWLLGGINVHVIHHLYPRICHTHYKELAPIVQATAEEYGLRYQTIPTFREAIVSHFKLLTLLGRKDFAMIQN
jgi:linoleoyl-CoA desaturase